MPIKIIMPMKASISSLVTGCHACLFVWVSSNHKIIITVGFPDNHLPDVISEKKIKMKLSWIVLWIHKSSRRTWCWLSEWLGCCVNSCISRPLQFWISIAWLSSVLATTARSSRNPPEAQSLPSSYTRTSSSTTSTCRTHTTITSAIITDFFIANICMFIKRNSHKKTKKNEVKLFVNDKYFSPNVNKEHKPTRTIAMFDEFTLTFA